MGKELLKQYIRDIPDFPRQGIIFKDVTPLLRRPDMFAQAVSLLNDCFSGTRIDAIVCIESRGFLFGAALALHRGCGLVIVRKKGKLPYKTYAQTYDLEYGTDTLEIHQDAIAPGESVVIIDDLLATGGTTQAVIGLIERMRGRVIGAGYLIELMFLKGREKLACPVFSLIQY